MEPLWVDPKGAAVGALLRAGVSLDDALLLPPALVEAARALELDEAELALGVELTRLLPESRLDRRVAFVGVIAALRLAMREGSTRLSLTQNLEFDRLGLSAAEDELALMLIRSANDFSPLVHGSTRTDAISPLLVDGGHLYARRMWLLETRLATLVQARLLPDATAPSSPSSSLSRSKGLERPDQAGQAGQKGPERTRSSGPFTLSDEQTSAVLRASTSPLTVIRGGPGTGKTSIVVALVTALYEAGLSPSDIALAAPTGKATDRLYQSVARALSKMGTHDSPLRTPPSALTLHRLLGYSPLRRSFRHHEDNPLSARVLVVDESSMVDLAMMDRILRALAPDARLVLLGDADQLPSVDTGLVFRDLCDALPPANVCTLTRSYRMDQADPAGRSVFMAAQEARTGQAMSSLLWRKNAQSLRFEGAEAVGADQLETFLDRWWERQAPEPSFCRRVYPNPLRESDHHVLKRGFDRSDRARLLSVTRGRQTGSERINQYLHQRAGTGLRWSFGQPVMVVRNDYELGLFNGDQGIVLGVGGRPSVVFVGDDEEPWRVFPLELLEPNIELAWCVTVHKAQGSEYDGVALVLPTSPTPLATREIIYTGLTRARRSVVVVGDVSMLEAAVQRRLTRNSGLRERLED